MKLIFLKGLSSCCVEKTLDECKNKSREISLESIAVVQAEDDGGLGCAGAEGVVRSLVRETSQDNGLSLECQRKRVLRMTLGIWDQGTNRVELLLILVRKLQKNRCEADGASKTA